MKWKLLVINSPAASVRQKMVTEMLSGHSFDWEFIFADANDIAQLNYDAKRAIRTFGRELQPGELGCYASHYKCWNFLLDHDSYDYLMVLEDDVFIDTNFDFSGLIKLIENTSIEYLRLYSRAFPKNSLVEKVSMHRKIYRFKGQAYGTQCYLLSSSGAEKLSKVAEEGVLRPLDDEMDRFWKNKLPNYAFYPYPALELDFQSTIRSELPPISATGLDYVMFKLRQKKDGLLRRLFNVFYYIKDKDICNRLKVINTK